MIKDASPGLSLFGLPIDPLTHQEVLDRCRHAVDARERLLVGVVNAAKIVNLRKDPDLRDSIMDCDLVVADGQSVVWASHLLHCPIPERVAGIDLFESLLELANLERRSIYLLGAKPDVLKRLVDRIGQRYPHLRIVGARDGYFDLRDSSEIAAEIRRSRADMLFLGMTSPKKEIFLGTHSRSLGVPVLHGVGGSFDVLAGVTRRAPVAWQRAGMEWAYRLLQEPRRMWKRYLRTNCGFVVLTIREMIKPTPAYRASSAAAEGPRTRSLDPAPSHGAHHA